MANGKKVIDINRGTIKLTNSQADALLRSILYKEMVKLDLPVIKMYLLKDTINEIDTALSTFRKQREDIINKYSKKDEAGKTVSGPDGLALFENNGDRKSAIMEINEIGSLPLKVAPKKVELSINDLPQKMRMELGDFIDVFCEVKR